MVCLPVGAHHAGSVDTECNRQILQAHILQYLVVGSLQEGRIHRHVRPHSSLRQTRRERHTMAFGDSNIKEPLGELLAKAFQSDAIRHGSADRSDPVIAVRHQGEFVAEQSRIRFTG